MNFFFKNKYKTIEIAYFENSEFFYRQEYDENQNGVYFVNFLNYWAKRVFCENHNRFFYEDCKGFKNDPYLLF